MQTIYTISIKLYSIALHLAAIFDKKASFWVKGRKHYFANLIQAIERNHINDKNAKVAWFHCASLGEFEQGRPIMENFRLQHPNYKIVLTFFSPSGYEVRKTYSGADLVLYLPIDLPSKVKKFVDILKPDIVVFIKYEFWFNILSYLQVKQIPILLASASFRPNQLFFRWYGEWFRKILRGFNHLFVQNEQSKELLSFIGINNVTVSGDTRFDRVALVAENPNHDEIVSAFSSNSNILIAGSTWEPDENILINFMKTCPDNLKLIIAPHEIHTQRITKLIDDFSCKTVCYTTTNNQEVKEAKILIIDTIGLLTHIYQYGTFAYIGGGFGAGIHNVLEPAAFGLPIFFGPKMTKFQEAFDLIDRNSAFIITNASKLSSIINNLLQNSAMLKESSEGCLNYVTARKGSTDIIMQYLANMSID